MTDKRQAEGATGGRWYNSGRGIFRRGEGVKLATLVASVDWQEDARRFVDLLNRGERAPTEASLRALREARDAWYAAPENGARDHALWELGKAVESVLAREPETWACTMCKGAHHPRGMSHSQALAVLSSSAAEPAKLTDDDGAPWDEAAWQRGIANLEQIVRSMLAPEPGKVEAKRKVCDRCGLDVSVCDCEDPREVGYEPSPPEPQGAQGPERIAIKVDGDGELAVMLTSDHSMPTKLVHYVRADLHAVLETKLAEAEDNFETSLSSAISARDLIIRDLRKERDEARAKLDLKTRAHDELALALGRMARERDEARAKLARYEASLRELQGGAPCATCGRCPCYEHRRETVAAPEPPNPPAAGEEKP